MKEKKIKLFKGTEFAVDIDNELTPEPPSFKKQLLEVIIGFLVLMLTYAVLIIFSSEVLAK